MKSFDKAFTLAELLIALAILGVIATFTIPKVLTANQNSQKNAVAKEAASAFVQAYQEYQRNKTPTASTRADDLIPYINYVRLLTSNEQIDSANTSNQINCGTSGNCVLLHNGAVLYFWGIGFGGTGLNAISMTCDPDGKYSGSSTGPGKAVEFALYFNGRLATWGTTTPGTNGGSYNPCPACDPEWLSWN